MRKIRVGIMGTGDIARVMAMTIARARGVSCYAVGSRTFARAEQFAREHRIRKAYGSYEELVADPKVDLIYVATPHTMHCANAKLAIAARKAVLVEKPFTVNEAEACELISMAREKNVLIAEAMWIRYMPSRARIREVIAQNLIGVPALLTASLGYPVAQRERMRRLDLGGGALLDLGVYPLHFASMVFGNDVAEITSLCSRDENGVDQQVGMSLVYRDGRVANLSCTSVAVSDRSGVIQGTRGYMVIDNINNPSLIEVFDNNHKRVKKIRCPKQISGYEYEIYACANAIRNRQIECLELPHDETLKILNMMDFIRGQLNIRYPGESGYTEPVLPAPETPAIETEAPPLLPAPAEPEKAEEKAEQTPALPAPEKPEDAAESAKSEKPAEPAPEPAEPAEAEKEEAQKEESTAETESESEK